MARVNGTAGRTQLGVLATAAAGRSVPQEDEGCTESLWTDLRCLLSGRVVVGKAQSDFIDAGGGGVGVVPDVFSA